MTRGMRVASRSWEQPSTKEMGIPVLQQQESEFSQQPKEENTPPERNLVLLTLLF